MFGWFLLDSFNRIKTMICSFKLQLAFWFMKPVFEFQVYISLNISVTILTLNSFRILNLNCNILTLKSGCVKHTFLILEMAWNISSALSYLCSSITRWWCCCGDGSSHQWDLLDFQLPLTRGKWWWVFPQRPPLVAEPSPCGVYHSHSPASSDPAHSRIQPPLLAKKTYAD